MSRKAGLHAENYTVKEQVERDTADAETGLNQQQQSSEGLKIEGLALPFNKRSRNGVVYQKESVQEAAESLVGCSLLFNHDEDNPIGHIEDVEITDEGLKYYGDLNEERKEVESLKRGDIPHVSIQAMIEETGNTETNGEVAITEFLEMSAVTVPGFSSTDVETSDETVLIEKLMTEEEAEEKLQQGKDDVESEQVDEVTYEFQPIPSLVLYDNEGDARERAKDLGVEGIHQHEYEGQTYWMAGSTHGQWRQLVGKQSAEKLSESFSDYPQEAVENARQALEAKDNSEFDNDDCGTQVGWERANQLDNGENLTKDTVQRMHSFFERHDGDQEVDGDGPKEEDCGWITWQAWGGQAAFDWATEKLEEIEDSEEAVSKEPFAGYDSFEACVQDNQDKSDPEAYCAAIKRRAEGKSILGENTYMTKQEQEEDGSAESEENQETTEEQLSEDDLEEVMGVVGGALQGAEEDIVDGAQAELDLSDEQAETLGGIVEQVMQEAVDQMEDDLQGSEDEAGDMDDEEDDEEEEKGGDYEDDEEQSESTESESSDLKQGSQNSDNDMDSKTREELENRVEELEEKLMKLEDTEPSKQEAANTPSNSDNGFPVRKDIKDRLER